VKHFALLCLGASLLLGCRKEDVVVWVPDGATTLAQLRLRNGPSQQTFAFDLNQPQTLTTAGAATIRFPANGFTLPNGQLATGRAEFRVVEIYSVPDMILADMPTTTDRGELLISAGEFRLQAWQGSTRLRLGSAALPSSIPVLLSLTSPQPAQLDTTRMLLWQQTASLPTSSPGDSVGWRYVPGPQPLGMPNNFYQSLLPLDSLGWWNLDQFWHAYANARIARVVVGAPAATETRVYLHPVGYNALARLYPGTDPAQWEIYMPVGADMQAIVLQSRNDKLYYGTLRVTTQDGLLIQPPLQELSEAEIVRRIREL
jgi:hypothetical protein